MVRKDRQPTGRTATLTRCISTTPSFLPFLSSLHFIRFFLLLVSTSYICPQGRHATVPLIMAADQEITLIIVFVNFCSVIWSYFCITASLDRRSSAYELVHETELVWHAFWSSCQVRFFPPDPTRKPAIWLPTYLPTYLPSIPPRIKRKRKRKKKKQEFNTSKDLRATSFRHKLRIGSLHRLPRLVLLRRKIQLGTGIVTKSRGGNTRGCSAAGNAAGELYSVQPH